MAILHTPRTLAAIARGMLKRRRRLNAGGDAATAAATGLAAAASRFPGFVPAGGDGKNDGKDNDNDNAHVYRARPNLLWDVDYMGHVNNAAYLTHAEYARWEWTAEAGALAAMHQKGLHFVVTQTAVRFRKEIPLRQDFEIHSILAALDDRHLWIHQTFRGGDKKDDIDGENNGGGGKGRILAQVLVQAAIIQNRKVVHPCRMLEAMDIPKNVAESLAWKYDKDDDENNNNNGNDDDDLSFLLQSFHDLDNAFRREAAHDDERLVPSSTSAARKKS